MKTVAILFLLLVTTASLAQTKVASNTSITVTGTVSISDSIRILNLGIAIGLSRCPPTGCSAVDSTRIDLAAYIRGITKPVTSATISVTLPDGTIVQLPTLR